MSDFYNSDSVLRVYEGFLIFDVILQTALCLVLFYLTKTLKMTMKDFFGRKSHFEKKLLGLVVFLAVSF